MSAVNSNSTDRELEALRRAQRAHEPSMEEILASIRDIIADDRELLKAGSAKSSPQRPAAPAAGPQIVFSKDAAAPQREETAGTEPNTPKIVLSQPQPAAFEAGPTTVSKVPPPTVSEMRTDEEPLLSPETGKAVASAFEALSANLAARRAEVADQMVRDLLRPMLKTWLDENLPGIVERLVRGEIERVARGPR